jgi:hypothetical protein
MHVQPCQHDHRVTKNLGKHGRLVQLGGSTQLVPTQLLLEGTAVHKLGTPKRMMLLAKVHTICCHCFLSSVFLWLINTRLKVKVGLLGSHYSHIKSIIHVDSLKVVSF